MKISEFQHQIDQIFGARDRARGSAGTFQWLTEEVGELARIMARRYGDQSEKESDKGADLGDEMADVLWVLLCLANQCNVDLTSAFNQNLEKKTLRDSDRHKNNPKLR
jgi:NTP pyrophosphatase (non-canonical NTP hydrolase)